MAEELFYKDVRVSPSSEMGQLLQLTQTPEVRAKVEALYQACEAEYKKWWH